MSLFFKLVFFAGGLLNLSNGLSMLRRPALHHKPEWPTSKPRFIWWSGVASIVAGALIILQSLTSAFSE